MSKPCGCGNTKNAAGLCDGSHNTKASKEIPHTKLTIRCISTKGEPQRVKNLMPTIANNGQLMKTMGFVISDPLYEKKMEAFKAKRPFIENGQASVPAKESFAPKQEVPDKPKEEREEQPKSEEKQKRTRRTKEQIEADKINARKTATA